MHYARNLIRDVMWNEYENKYPRQEKMVQDKLFQGKELRDNKLILSMKKLVMMRLRISLLPNASAHLRWSSTR